MDSLLDAPLDMMVVETAPTEGNPEAPSVLEAQPATPVVQVPAPVDPSIEAAELRQCVQNVLVYAVELEKKLGCGVRLTALRACLGARGK